MQLRRRISSSAKATRVSLCTLTFVCVFMMWYKSSGTQKVDDRFPPPSTKGVDPSNHRNHQARGDDDAYHGTAAKPKSSTALSAVEQCVQKKTDVLLVGNRPVGTYICSYFPEAKAVPGGCQLKCPSRQSSSSKSFADFTCTVLAMGSHDQLRSADIVVNHHGPVPKRFSPLEPVLTVFYSGESNASEGKKALHSYQTKYDVPISFHTHRHLYFTWTNRFLKDFQSVLQGQLQRQWPPWAARRSAVAIFVSRCKKGGRESVIQGLTRHYPVHSFGKCHRTHTIEVEFPKCASLAGGRYPQKLCVFQQYKYILALDNSKEQDYVTEKVYHALLSGAVPIYDGAPNADEYLPGGWSSVVSLSAFMKSDGSVYDYEALARHLRKLDTNATSEREALQKWTRATVEDEWGEKFVDHMHHEEPTCELCDMARWKRCQQVQ